MFSAAVKFWVFTAARSRIGLFEKREGFLKSGFFDQLIIRIVKEMKALIKIFCKRNTSVISLIHNLVFNFRGNVRVNG